MNPIAATSSVAPIGLPPLGNQAASPKPGAGGFAQLVENFVAKTNEAQVSSDQSIDDLVQGKTDNVQQVVMAMANAELSFQLFMEIRNKLIDSYNELMRMQF
jgi:flagellar hook-basal body complex protein FliE